MQRFISLDLLIASIIFFLGICYYYFFREPTIVANWLGIDTYNVFSSYAKYFNWYPSFSHVFFFSVITWLGFDRCYENLSIGIWVFLNLLFELMQGKSPLLTTSWLPLNTQEILSSGTYANEDIVAIIIAGIFVKIYMRFSVYLR